MESKWKNGSIIFCYRNPNTGEMEHGLKENNKNGTPPPPEKIMVSKWKLDPVLEIPILGKRPPPPGLRKIMTRIWEMDPLFCTRKKWAPVPLEHGPKENKIIMAPALPPPREKIRESKWKMDPLFSAIETPTLRKWNMDPKKFIVKWRTPFHPIK